MNGRGIYKYSNGDIYEGYINERDLALKKKKFNLTKITCQKKGEYKDGHMSGQGVFRYANGEIYEG